MTCIIPFEYSFRSKIKSNWLFTTAFWTGIRRFLGCDHIRSYEYFTESIQSSCPFMAFSCNSWQDFVDSTCIITQHNKMGFHATKPSGNASAGNNSIAYYSITGPRPPFCSKISIRITMMNSSSFKFKWIVMVLLHFI